jgi:ABC-type Fe3+-siderophore transport system permease subunit
MLGWIPFRARTLEETVVLLGRVFDWRAYTYLSFRESSYLLVAALFGAIIAMHFAMKLLERSQWMLLRQSVDVASTAIAGFAVVICLRQVSQFIYFQF